MEDFLRASKSALREPTGYERARVVLGNSTCDLDSAVCALAQGYRLYREELERSRADGGPAAAVFAVMNIPENEYRLKTEVVWFLEKHGITRDELTFRDQIDLGALARAVDLEVTLVDHHATRDGGGGLSGLEDRVVEIIDHRPRDPIWPWSEKVRATLEQVGSCATLVGNSLSKERPEILEPRLRGLLRGTILLDTYELSSESGRTVDLDREVVARLEDGPESRELERSALPLSTPRRALYESLLKAKTEISGLTVEDLLAKDLKVVGDVALPVLPILVQELSRRPGALESIGSFAAERSFGIVVIIGISTGEKRTRRDLGVYSGETAGIRLEETTALLRDSDLELEEPPPRSEAEEERVLDGRGGRFVLFEQRNLRLTRKYVVPLIRRAALARRAEGRNGENSRVSGYY